MAPNDAETNHPDVHFEGRDGNGTVVFTRDPFSAMYLAFDTWLLPKEKREDVQAESLVELLAKHWVRTVESERPDLVIRRSSWPAAVVVPEHHHRLSIRRTTDGVEARLETEAPLFTLAGNATFIDRFVDLFTRTYGEPGLDWHEDSYVLSWDVPSADELAIAASVRLATQDAVKK